MDSVSDNGRPAVEGGSDPERDAVTAALEQSGLDPRDIEAFDEFRDTPDDGATFTPWEEHAEAEQHDTGYDRDADIRDTGVPDYVAHESDRLLDEQSRSIPPGAIH